MPSPSKEPAPQPLKLRFFDLDVHIRSDSRACLNPFAQMYRRFRANGVSPPVQPPVEFAILTQPDNAWGQPVLILDGKVQPLRDPRLLAGYVHQSILCAILARVRSHVLIHAGAVANDGQGFILAADSLHGKTTLALELVRRGFKFLSDDTAALGRADRRLHPFPRCLRLRPGTLDLAGLPEAVAGAPEWLGKQLLDIEQIQPDSLGQAAPLSHVVVLRDPAEEREERPGPPDRELGVLVDRLDEDLLADVHHIEGVTDLHVDVERGYPLLRLRTARRTFVFSHIEALCQAQRILVLDVITGPAGPPSFAAPARLEAIPRSQAIVELLRRFQGGYKSAILDEFGGSSTRLFMELAAIIGQAECYQLFVGPLHEMADLVCGLVGTV
jgi:hypothetical protein